MKLIIKSADYALTRSTMYGILQGCRDGMITTTGLMVNFPWSEYAVELIKPYTHVCLGQDINITVGRPVSDPKEIPTMVNEDGTFVSSKKHRGDKDYVIDMDEALLETENQVKRFIKLTGKLPEYMQSHAQTGAGKIVIHKAIKAIADKYGVKQYAKARENLIYSPRFMWFPCLWKPRLPAAWKRKSSRISWVSSAAARNSSC
jgi:predicted glycoside hydrolase/deacetylase ChbG (UPF0249 family)